MRALIFFIFTHLCLANSPIEGGVDVPLDERYKSFLRIETPDGYSCSATKVSKNTIITAAHCVIGRDSTPLYKIGDKILSYGKVTKIDIHPSYIQSEINLKSDNAKLNSYIKKAQSMSKEEVNTLIESNDFKLLTKRLETLNSKNSQSDIAFITLDKTFNDALYPKIINSKSKFIKRGNIEVIGFGTTKKIWNEKAQDYLTNEVNNEGSLAMSCWSSSPNTYDTSIDAFSDDIIGVLNFKATIKHNITSFTDTQTRSQNMVMPGDSGAPAVEYDIHSKPIITAIASTGSDFADQNNNLTLNIELPNKEKVEIVYEQGINNWGDPQKADLEFPQIIEKLTSLGLYENGKIKDGVKLTRAYTRQSTATFADLLHPDNQKFIAQIMGNLK